MHKIDAIRKQSQIEGNEKEKGKRRRARRPVPVSPGIWMLVLIIAQSFSLRSGASDGQAQEILAKMVSVYQVKSYQGSALVSEQSMSDATNSYTVSGTQEVFYKAPNRFMIRSTGDEVGGTVTKICDGKQLLTVHEDKSTHSKVTSNYSCANQGSTLLFSLFGLSIDLQSGRCIGSTTVGNRPAYRVEVSMCLPALRANSSPEERKQMDELKRTLQPFELDIDKKDHHLLRVVQTAPHVVPRGRPATTRTMEFTHQSFNLDLPDNRFVVRNHNTVK